MDVVMVILRFHPKYYKLGKLRTRCIITEERRGFK